MVWGGLGWFGAVWGGLGSFNGPGGGASPEKFKNPRLSEKPSECLLNSFISRNFDENLVAFYIFTFYFVPFSRE